MTLKKTLLNATERAMQLAQAIEVGQFGSSEYQDRKITRLFGITDAAKLVGVDRSSIIRAEDDGRLPPPALNDNNRRMGYSIENINTMRGVFNTFPWRKDNERCIVMSIIGHKGGSWKTSVTVHLAQWLALKGYRVLLADHDPQGTASLYHGHSPLTGVNVEDTLLPFYRGEQDTLDYAIQETYWPNLDIVASGPVMQAAEKYLTKGLDDVPGYLLLHEALESVKEHYDFILVDGAPNLGMGTVNMAFAADVMLVPTPAEMYDYISTASLFATLSEMIEDFDDSEFQPLLKMLVTKYSYQPQSSSQLMFELIRDAWGSDVLPKPVKETGEVGKTQLRMRTVFEQATSQRSTPAAYKNALAAFEPVFNDIMRECIKPFWPNLDVRG